MASARITFDDFQSACCTYLAQRDALSTPQQHQLSWASYAPGWTWQDALLPGPAFSGTAGLHRSYAIIAHHNTTAEEKHALEDEMCASTQVADDTDDATYTPTTTRRVIQLEQSIHWSPVWSVPVLYFHATLNDRPISLDDLQGVGIVHDAGTLAAHLGEALQPVSVGDHPRSGLPSFYLHPCNTSSALSSLLAQDEEAQYVASFVALCASAVHMRPP
ncbi:hypothetical protein PaG_00046 [Moesziomyces aphidis]|uniref:Ubiquitin-like-conjugating enzyme ATG10 n=1 Tax=Moesziomyces aphidis TaxID=84754 RepID=W3VUM9_MOEAP|nr:hypothetical protein PaG_00046 [Moesziomyces aphidis]